MDNRHRTAPATIHRRQFMKALGLGIAATAVASSHLFGTGAEAQTPGLITKQIPRPGEVVPAIGLGSFLTFDVLPGHPREHLREVIRRFSEGGGRVIDTSPLYGMAEVNVGDFATALGINDRVFIGNKLWSTGEYLADDSHAARSLEQSTQRLWRDQIDLMQCHSLVNVDVIVPLLRAWKKEGRIRYIGVTHHEPAYFGVLAQWVEQGDVDFVQVRYSIYARMAEGRPLPDFARELGIETWAQFFLTWVISHPAVTCAIPATASPEHLSENIAAMRGPLPDRDMRARMVRYMETIPGFDTLDEMPWYPDKTYPGVIGRAQRELRRRT